MLRLRRLPGLALLLAALLLAACGGGDTDDDLTPPAGGAADLPAGESLPGDEDAQSPDDGTATGEDDEAGEPSGS